MKQKRIMKIIYILMIIIILEFSISPISNAAFTGILTKPICYLFVGATDAINFLFSAISVPPGENLNELNTAFDNNDLSATANILMSPDRIFSGDVPLLEANIFKADVETSNISLENLLKSGDQSLVKALKKTVSNIYVLLRNISALILLCLLIYTGIRILLMSASPYDQAKWKQALIDWVKALCLLMFMHIIMVGTFYISDLLVDAMKNSFGNLNIVSSIRSAFSNTSIWDGTGAIMITILYIYITYLSIVFFIAYFKRLTWIVILIVISPIVATTYALGQSQRRIFSTWFKEYVGAVIIQPFHIMIFYVLVAIPLGMMTQNNMTGGFLATVINNLNPLNQTSLAVHLYTIIAISMIRPAEKFLMKLFGIDQSSVARQGSSESGVKTIKAAEKVVKDVAMTAVQIGSAVATGGATAAMGATAAASAGAVGEAGATAETATNAIGMAEEGKQIASERNALDEMYNEGMSPESDRGVDDYKAYMELDKEQSAREAAFADENKEGGLKSAADALKEAADALKEVAGNFDVSDAEFDKTMGDQNPKSKNKFMERLESNPLYNYARSPEGKERFNELRAGANELRDSMYLEDAPQEWKKGEFGYDSTKSRIDQSKKDGLNAFVNNKNNISYMKQAHDLSTEDAKKRLQEAEPYINRGITDIGAIDKMILAQREGRNPDQAIRAVAKETRTQANINKTVNDQSKINAVAQIIASSTGSRADSPKVQQQAKQTMEAARPYIAKGEKDPEVLHRLVQLENNLKNSKAGANVRTPDKVMRMDKKIDQAMKNGLNKVNMKTNQSTSQGMKQIESVMNKELRNRKSLGSNNPN